MQQSTRRLMVLLSGTFLAAGGLLAAACSTDNGSGGSSGLPTVEAGKDTGSSGSVDSGTDSPSADDCGAAPKVRDNSTGFFCAFLAKDAGPVENPGADGGDPRYCTNAETCCNPPDNANGTHNTTFCAPTKVDDTGCATYATAHTADGLAWPLDSGKSSSAFECADKSNCATGVCCATKLDGGVNFAWTTDKSLPASCNALIGHNLGGTRCATSCSTAEVELCGTTDNNCAAGTTCTPFQGFFRDLAYCK